MQAAWILVPIILITAVIIVLLLRPPAHTKCPSCGRRRVAGQATCPACGFAFGSAPQASRGPTRLDRSPSPPPEQAPYLAAIAGPLRGQNVPISSSYFTVGRSSDNELRIDGHLVSRQHALIVRQDGRNVLYDRESTNGTWVDGRRIAQHVLQPGEQIQVGPAVFVFQQAGAEVEPQPVRPVEVPRILTPSPEAVAQRVHALSEYSLGPIPGGSGGVARVYKGVSRRDGSVVAVKVLYQTDPYLRAKFEQEGRKIGLLLRHPHIAEVYHYGQSDEGTFYILMEYVENGALRQRIRPRGMPLDEVIRITGEVCDALHYAHSQRVIHRDIKPENILLSAEEEVKLVDFGIAKLIGERTVTQDGLLIGTPLYMSYEQAKGRPVDQRSDIYALGIVLYEMLTGQVPFTGQPLTVVHKHLTEAPTPPSKLNDNIPTKIEQVVMRAMEKDINKRFRTVEEMARALGYTAPFSLPKPSVAKPPAYPAAPRRQAAAPGLVVVHTGQTLPLTGNVTILHRQDINPMDRLISRDHARIVRRGANLWLEDMGSTNGTNLNGQRLFEPALLRAGDEISLGTSVLRVAS